ncbi:MAG: ABC transporter permease [Clostridiales bacterium]|nr:ABC transporter permease [Clostridiales bacterium]
MRLAKLSFHNFKKSFHNYFSLILSLAFTVMIIFNFVNLLYTDKFTALSANKGYIESVVNVLEVVLWCFMFFFIWYSANVFLTKKKKEIGIYVFMGLTNQRIGWLYMMEMSMIGIVALILGILGGMVTTHLFQMTLLAISEITVDISFTFEWKPVLITSVIYLVIYMVFVVKGYINIVRSSVLSMISATRQNEYVKSNAFVLFVKMVLGVAALTNGYYTATKDGGMETLNNILAGTVFVIIGTYFIFGGLLPFVFQRMAQNKAVIYKHERNLWINNVIFRMKKNYRTYAMTCVLLTCAVTALAASFAAKGQYDNMVNFRNTYTYQIITSRDGIGEEAAEIIGRNNEIEYSARIPFLQLDGSYFDTYASSYGIVSFSNVKQLAADTGLNFPYEKLEDDETVFMNHVYLLSLYWASERDIEICGKTYKQLEETMEAYLGYFQEQISFFMVSDSEYERIKAKCEQDSAAALASGNVPLYAEVYTYNYRIADIYNFEASVEDLQAYTVLNNTDDEYMGLVKSDPYSSDIVWIKLEYSLCVFVFLVFVMASGSILFMKLYNDAFEEKERYAVLHKIGVSETAMAKAVAKELRVAYAAPFLLMTLSSYFAVHSLEKMMSANLKMINILSVVIILVIFLLFYMLSVIFYRKNAGVYIN